MLDPVGFWSYARQDDAHSDGQLSQLRAIVGKQIILQCGDEVKLWQDIVAIPFGVDWSSEIERTIGQTTFFIPIITPRFLKSRHCCDEFVAFRRRMQAMGRDDLIFPVHYVTVEDMRPSETIFGDQLDALRRHQWIDFRPLVFEDPKSTKVKQWAAQLAAGILAAMRRDEAARRLEKKKIEVRRVEEPHQQGRPGQEEAQARLQTENNRGRQETEPRRRDSEGEGNTREPTEAAFTAYATLMRDAFSYPSNLGSRKRKPNWEAHLAARFARTHAAAQKVMQKARVDLKQARMSCAAPLGGIQDNTVNRLLLMSSSENHLPNVPFAFFIEPIA
jgi:hypothetical protein